MVANNLQNLNSELSKLKTKFPTQEARNNLYVNAVKVQANQVRSKANLLRQEYGISTNTTNGSNQTKVINNLTQSDSEISTGTGNDVINNITDSNDINSGGGRDVIQNTGSDNYINAGSGNDVIESAGSGNHINAGSGNDVIINNGDNNTIRAGSGNDVIIHNVLNGRLDAGSGNDTIKIGDLSGAPSRGTVNVKGGSGNDTLILTGEAEDFTLNTDRSGNKYYVHNASQTKISVSKDVEKIKFEAPIRATGLIDPRIMDDPCLPFPNYDTKEELSNGLNDYFKTARELQDSIAKSDTTKTTNLEQQLNSKSTSLLNNTDKIKISFDDFTDPSPRVGLINPLMAQAQNDFFINLSQATKDDLVAQREEALKINTAAGRASLNAIDKELASTNKNLNIYSKTATLMGQLGEKLEIDFGGITKEQAKYLYEINTDIARDSKEMRQDAMRINTDAGKMSEYYVRSDEKMTNKILSELERQFGFQKTPTNEDKVLIKMDQNNLMSLETRMSDMITNFTGNFRPQDIAATREALNIERKIVKEDLAANPNQGRYTQSQGMTQLFQGVVSNLESELKDVNKITDIAAQKTKTISLTRELDNAKINLAFWTETTNFWKP
jgi:Ca2+-binding RTX toxin-like protein